MKKKPAKNRSANAPSNHLRIIGGQWRGRKLTFPSTEGLRPTGDRIRETLFNWLQFELPEARCLDLFAGSGALALESLSRRAEFCLMIEKDGQACAQLNSHLVALECRQAQVLNTDSLDWLAQCKPEDELQFNVVFCDPPFALRLWQRCFELLESKNLIKEGGWIYVEAPKNESLDFPSQWQIHRKKSTGQVDFYLLNRAS